MKPLTGALNQFTTLVALLKVIHEVSVTPDGIDVTAIEYTMSLETHWVESSVKATKVTDYDAVPRVYVLDPGEVPEIVIEPVEVAQVITLLYIFV